MCHRLKQTANIKYYADQLNLVKNDSKIEMWKLLRTMIRKSNDKSNILVHVKFTNGITNDPHYISNIFINVFTNVGTKHANTIHQPKQSFSKYLLNCRK